jgi:hypothetical protein
MSSVAAESFVVISVYLVILAATPPHPASASLGHPLPAGERKWFDIGAPLADDLPATLVNLLSPAGRGWPSEAEAG